jgi:glucan phosphoethanolaminetransferase (alkaline phosphatase superfamily)
VPLGIGALVFAVARSFERGSSVRGLWMTFALALLSFGVGGAVFIALYVITGRDTYPSFAEIFTLVGYAIFGLAFYRALRAYRGFLSLRAPMLVAATVSAAVLGAIYFTVIGPYVLGTQPAVQSALARGFNTLYIVLDVVVLLLPSVALALLLRKLGKGRVAWPWWFVAAGAASLVIPDTMFAYMGAVGMGRSVAVDMGYALAPMLIGLAVLVAREVYRS